MRMLGITVLILCTCFLVAASVLAAGENIVLGRPAVFDPAPNYGLCTDPEDILQLTDGKFAGDGFWFDKLAVGWSSATSISITFDLGSIQPVSGMMYSTSSRGNAGVLWPRSLFIFISDDGITYRYAGDLISLDRINGIPAIAEEKEIRHKFKTNELQTHGRFIKISVLPNGPYSFVDEIEIYKGPDSFLTQTKPEEIITDVKAFTERQMQQSAIMDRLSRDISDIKSRVKKSHASASVKSSLLKKLADSENRLYSLPLPDRNSFKAILPLNDVHASIYAVYGELMHQQNKPAITLWKKHRYDRLQPMEQPNKSKAAINIDALQNEFRADSFIISNNTSSKFTANLRIDGLPDSTYPGWLDISCVPWTDTASRQPVSAALPSAKHNGSYFKIEVPAGLNTMIWFTVDTSKLQPGTYKGSAVLSSNDETMRIPVNIHVSKISMSKPRLSLGMWDYTHNIGDRGMVPANIQSATDSMKNHFVDSPWASSDALPRVENLSDESFTVLDNWIKRWPEARQYMVFCAVGDEFNGTKIGDSGFKSKVADWAVSIDKHLRSIGIDPQKLVILLVDEPGSDTQDSIIAAWARSIKDSGAKIRLFQDPIWEHPENNKIQEAITLADILCPNMPIYYQGGESVRKYYNDLIKSGHQVWFYQCSGPVRTFDPSAYYRMMAWHAFKAGFVGMGFWSFGDLGGGQSSWNEYAIPGTAYAPAFVDPSGVTDSVHWQAIREGIEDYECLSMLKSAISECQNEKLRAQAQSLLDKAVNTVTANYKPEYTWKDNPLHKKIDDYRIKIIQLLEKM